MEVGTYLITPLPGVFQVASALGGSHSATGCHLMIPGFPTRPKLHPSSSWNHSCRRRPWRWQPPRRQRRRAGRRDPQRCLEKGPHRLGQRGLKSTSAWAAEDILGSKDDTQKQALSHLLFCALVTNDSECMCVDGLFILHHINYTACHLTMEQAVQSHGMLATPKSLVVILSPWQCRSNRRCWHHHASRHFLGSRQEGQALRQERRNGCGHHHNGKHSTSHLLKTNVASDSKCWGAECR